MMCVSESVHCSESQLANFTYVTLVSEDGEDDGEDDDEDDGEDDDDHGGDLKAGGQISIIGAP